MCLTKTMTVNTGSSGYASLELDSTKYVPVAVHGGYQAWLPFVSSDNNWYAACVGFVAGTAYPIMRTNRQVTITVIYLPIRA